jgi:transposase
MTSTGIDLHKSFCYLTSTDEIGTVVKESKIKNNRDDILRYFSDLPGPNKAVVECTIGWYWLTDLLRENGIEIILANTRMTKAIAAAKVKTDKIDATVLSHLLRMDYIPAAYQLDPSLRAHRDVIRFRLRLVQKRVSSINSVYRLVEKFNLEDPEDLPGSYYYQYQQLQAHIDLLDEQITSIEGGLSQTVLQSPEVQRIIRIPGIGEIDAYSIVLETADIRRFATEKNYFSYARLVPGASNSGGKSRHNYKVSKAGNKYLKIAFTDAGVHAVRYYPEIREFYKRKLRKKGKRLAQNLVAKELARIVYHVLSTETDYNNMFKGKELSHIKRHRWPRPTSPRPQLVF